MEVLDDGLVEIDLTASARLGYLFANRFYVHLFQTYLCVAMFRQRGRIPGLKKDLEARCNWRAVDQRNQTWSTF